MHKFLHLIFPATSNLFLSLPLRTTSTSSCTLSSISPTFSLPRFPVCSVIHCPTILRAPLCSWVSYPKELSSLSMTWCWMDLVSFELVTKCFFVSYSCAVLLHFGLRQVHEYHMISIHSLIIDPSKCMKSS